VTPLVLGLQLGSVIGLFMVNRSLLRRWRLSIRREEMLVRSCMTYDELLRRSVTGTLDEDELRLGLQLVNVGAADELAAQTLVGWRTRIPQVGEPWPDSMLADVLDHE